MRKKTIFLIVALIVMSVFYVAAAETTIIIKDEADLIKTENELIKIEKEAKDRISFIQEESEEELLLERKTRRQLRKEERLKRKDENNKLKFVQTKEPVNPLVKSGRTMTVLGIVGLVQGISSAGIAAGTGVMALYYAGALTPLLSSGAFSWTTFLATAASTPLVGALSAATVLFGVLGVIAFGFSLFLLPGIITWAIGAGKQSRTKRKSKVMEKFDLLYDDVGFAIKIS